jgi:DNA-binding NarL/FixJ family response regulator
MLSLHVKILHATAQKLYANNHPVDKLKETDMSFEHEAKTWSTRPVSVLVADDHSLIRDAMKMILSADRGFDTRVANDFDGAMSLIATDGPIDVLLLDLQMPGMDGLSSIERAIAAMPDGAVVLFSGHVEAVFLGQAIALGARGYIPKTLPVDAFSAALRLVATGQSFLPSDYFTGGGQMFAKSESTDRDGLSQQEISVLSKVSMGKTNKEIAWAMNLSEVTVKLQMRSVCTKLKAKNRTHASMIAKQMGLI